MHRCSAGVDEVSTSTGKADTAPWTQIGAVVGGGVDSLGASTLTPSLAHRHAMRAPLAATRALRLSMDMSSSELGAESRGFMVVRKNLGKFSGNIRGKDPKIEGSEYHMLRT